MISDEFAIYAGKVVNFGVFFEVVSHKYANKHDVKLRCINTIIDYFDIDKMKFRQPIFTSELIYELMGLDGVRGVNHVELTQGTAEFNNVNTFVPELYDISIDGGLEVTGNNSNYGYFYDFGQFYGVDTIGGNGVIIPSVEPSVFELKNPNENVKGVVL